MTIDEAIEILQSDATDLTIYEVPDFIDAIHLGIEALKRLKDRRDLGTGWEITPLPGETK